MPENSASKNKTFSIDWLLRGTLTRLGDIFDRFTGRNRKPSSSLATSELIDRLKILLDREAKDSGAKGVFVPHNIKLKMQWDKFSLDDAQEALKKLENELLIAAVDHINDNRYHTFAPLKLEIKPDYFTEGVKILVGFDNFSEEESEAAVNVSVPDLKNIVISPPEKIEVEPEKEIFIADFSVQGKPKQVEFTLVQGQRLSVGRAGENDLSIDDNSVSKVHASLVLNQDNQLMVADTGSTNGTFVNDRRISYGKAFPVSRGDKLKFGLIDVSLQFVPKETDRKQDADQPENPESAAFSAPHDSSAKAEHFVAEEEDDGAADAETVLGEEIPAIKVKLSLDGNPLEENLQPTEQEIALDFRDKK